MITSKYIKDIQQENFDMTKKVLAGLVTALCVVLVAGLAFAAVPQTINYQGYLTNNSGQPVNGPVNFTFGMYSASSGGPALWTETHTGVQVTNGVYSVVLGNGSPTPSPLTLPFDTQYWLGITVGTDPEMTPRQALAVVPYAFRAAQADTVNSSSQIVSTVSTGTAPLSVSSTTVVPNLNADTVDNKHATDFAASGANTDITSLSGLNTQAAITVYPYDTVAGSTGEIRLKELVANGINNVGFKAPDAISADKIWTLPSADGTANQVLATNGEGRLGWLDLNGSTLQSVTGTDVNGVIRGTNTATPSLGYLGGIYGVYGEATGAGAAIYGRNTDTTGALGYGVKGQSGSSIGILGVNRSSCHSISYECNCDWDPNMQQIVCDTCYDTVCDMPGAGVYGQASAPDYAGQFDGNVKVNGGLNVQIGSSTDIGIVVQGAAGQTVSLQRWNNSAGTTVAYVGPAGQLNAGSISTTGQISAGTFSGNGSQLSNVTAANVTDTFGVTNSITGIVSHPTAAGQFLRSSASNTWNISAIQAADLPDLSGTYVDLVNPQTIMGTKTFANQVNMASNGLVVGTNQLIAMGDNVGIGTSLPTAKLEVAGNLKVSGSGKGLIFPDGTVQTTASAPTWHQILPAAERFVLVMNNNEAVLDKETGLVWERSTSATSYVWEDAISHCADVVIGGRKGWRLPAIEELATLVDPARSDPALPSGHPFTNVQLSAYWSSTRYTSLTDYAWNVFFSNGVVGAPFNGIDYYVRCVRGGQ